MTESALDGLLGSSVATRGPTGLASTYHAEQRDEPRPHPARRASSETLHREQVRHDADCAIAVRTFENARFDYPWHYHPEIELTLIVRGRGLRHVGDSIEEFGPGDLVLVGSGTPHCWLSYPSATRADTAIVVQFGPDVFGTGFLELIETRPLAVLLQRCRTGLTFGGAARDEAEERLRELTRPCITRLEKLSGLIAVLTTLATAGGRSLALHGSPHQGGESTRARALLAYIREHAAERLSREQVARHAGMSPGTFSRYFARQFGRPFVTYVAEVRIANACCLLREEELSVSEIAHSVGFHNLANFNRTFLRLKGTTPTAYRKLARSPG